MLIIENRVGVNTARSGERSKRWQAGTGALSQHLQEVLSTEQALINQVGYLHCAGNRPSQTQQGESSATNSQLSRHERVPLINNPARCHSGAITHSLKLSLFVFSRKLRLNHGLWPPKIMRGFTLKNACYILEKFIQALGVGQVYRGFSRIYVSSDRPRSGGKTSAGSVHRSSDLWGVNIFCRVFRPWAQVWKHITHSWVWKLCWAQSDFICLQSKHGKLLWKWPQHIINMLSSYYSYYTNSYLLF